MKKRYNNQYVDGCLVNRPITRCEDIVDGSTPISWCCDNCYHVWQTRPTKILKNNTGCPKCSYIIRGQKQCWTNNHVDEQLQKQQRTLVRLGECKMGSIKTTWKCLQCNHVWCNTPVQIITFNQGCPKCWKVRWKQMSEKLHYTNEEIDSKLQNRPINRLDDYIGMVNKIQWLCVKCNNKWLARPNDVINNKSDCPHCKPKRYSKQAIAWLEGLSERTGVTIQHAENGGEIKIPGTNFFVDGFCKQTNTIYEFYGDVYHGNLKIFNPDEMCHPFNNKTAKELYDKTHEREQQFIRSGYNVVTIWESDFLY